MVNYNKLWHKLVDLKMNKSQLRIASGISSSTLAKLGKNEKSIKALSAYDATMDRETWWKELLKIRQFGYNRN